MIAKAIAAAILATAAFGAYAGNMLTDSAISADGGWKVFVHAPIKEAGGNVAFESGKAIVDVPSAEGQGIQHIQIYKDIDLAADKSYKASFTAKTDKAGKITVIYLLGKPPYTTYASASVDLSEGEKSYDCVLNVKAAADGSYDTPRSFRFFLAGIKDAKIAISNVSLDEAK